jgi:hypothetical protein
MRDGVRATMPSGVRGRDGRREAVAERRPDDALLGDDPGDQLGRRHVEGRVPDVRPGRGDQLAADPEDLVGRPLLDLDRVAVRGRQVDRRRRRATRNGMPWRAARTASGYVPTLFAVSPFAATRSAPDDHDVDLAAAHQRAAATSGISVCGTPACSSSQAVRRAPWR